jgi:hypothetical protein
MRFVVAKTTPPAVALVGPDSVMSDAAVNNGRPTIRSFVSLGSTLLEFFYSSGKLLSFLRARRGNGRCQRVSSDPFPQNNVVAPSVQRCVNPPVCSRTDTEFAHVTNAPLLQSAAITELGQGHDSEGILKRQARPWNLAVDASGVLACKG